MMLMSTLILVVFLRAQLGHAREREVEKLLSHQNWLQHWTELRYQIVNQPLLLLKPFKGQFDDFALNRSTIRSRRTHHRAKKSTAIKAEFHGNVPLVIQ